ncbi:uncharacterized protein LOC121595645 [Anopheles merus]|uniref:uncharacterized protein LOC121595645 n=1 Tax=Anopheles merus TaxID=30066 RepID=UPI001BE4CB7F|nr:uncharacterized protein LOC121595645 [Anopheles merus]
MARIILLRGEFESVAPGGLQFTRTVKYAPTHLISKPQSHIHRNARADASGGLAGDKLEEKSVPVCGSFTTNNTYVSKLNLQVLRNAWKKKEKNNIHRTRAPTVSTESNPPRLAQHNSRRLFEADEKTPTTTASHEFIMLMMCGGGWWSPAHHGPPKQAPQQHTGGVPVQHAAPGVVDPFHLDRYFGPEIDVFGVMVARICPPG